MTTMTFASMPVRGPHRSSREESGKAHERTLMHKSVMVAEAVNALTLAKGDLVVDATFGRGGHSAAIKKAAKVKLITIDADPASGADLVGNFADIAALLPDTTINKALFDLGWNTTQLRGKGFSFMYDEPLNMSYGTVSRSGLTAADMLNTMSEKALADIFFGYGEERYARRIAAAVVARRDTKLFETTVELAELVKDAVPAAYRRGRLHPATKTFQALRIAVNDELGAIDQGLRAAWDMLAPGGRLVVITFHSIEDRAVKRLFAAFAKESGVLVYKKPLIPSRAEIVANPAARSAKLRAVEKTA